MFNQIHTKKKHLKWFLLRTWMEITALKRKKWKRAGPWFAAFLPWIFDVAGRLTLEADHKTVTHGVLLWTLGTVSAHRPHVFKECFFGKIPHPFVFLWFLHVAGVILTFCPLLMSHSESVTYLLHMSLLVKDDRWQQCFPSVEVAFTMCVGQKVPLAHSWSRMGGWGPLFCTFHFLTK